MTLKANNIEIKKDIVLNAYNQASREQKTLLENMFGKEMFHPKDIKERVKTFEDAIAVLGNDNRAVIDYYAIADNKTCAVDILAFAKLRVITEALNEGWNPTFNGKEARFHVYFNIFDDSEYEKFDNEEKRYYIDIVSKSSDGTPDLCHAKPDNLLSYQLVPSSPRLALKTRELAEYCGRQFMNIWADFLFS